MSNYRNNCFDPRTIAAFYSLPSNLIDNVAEISLDADYTDEDHYHEWIRAWKSTYRHLSEVINCVKKDRSVGPNIRDSGVHVLAKLANTLINARQHMLDQRRAKRFPRIIH